MEQVSFFASVQIRQRPRPYSPRWAARYTTLIGNLRQSILLVVVFLVVNVFLFLVPTFFGADRRGAALDGLLIIVCGIAAYGLYQWSKRLLRNIAENTRVE